MTQPEQTDAIIDSRSIYHRMQAFELRVDPVRVREILAKALELKGLDSEDV